MRRVSILFSLALGAAFIAAPSLTNFGNDNIYDSAFAAKGGNGKGNGGSNGNGNGKNNGVSASAKGSGKGSSGQITTSVASTGATKKQKMSAKQLALTDPTAPAHPSMLGRWNAAKPITHPAMQSHIRKGKFKGTIGMLAGYAVAQANYNSYQTSLAGAEPAVAGLASALSAAGYTSVADYQAAVAAGEATPVAAIDTALTTTTTDTTTGATTTTPMTAEQIAAADALAEQGATAFSDLSGAEANMEAYSNRAPWGDIRDDVREKMELNPDENDLVTDAPVDPAEPL